jgi:hypothetical protein
MQVTTPLIASQIAVTQGAAQPNSAATGGRPAFDPQQFMQNVIQNSSIGGNSPIISSTPVTTTMTAVMDMAKIANPQFDLKNIPPNVLRGLIDKIKSERDKLLSDKQLATGNIVLRKRAVKRYQEMIEGAFLDDEI